MRVQQPSWWRPLAATPVCRDGSPCWQSASATPSSSARSATTASGSATSSTTRSPTSGLPGDLEERLPPWSGCPAPGSSTCGSNPHRRRSPTAHVVNLSAEQTALDPDREQHGATVRRAEGPKGVSTVSPGCSLWPRRPAWRERVRDEPLDGPQRLSFSERAARHVYRLPTQFVFQKRSRSEFVGTSRVLEHRSTLARRRSGAGPGNAGPLADAAHEASVTQIPSRRFTAEQLPGATAGATQCPPGPSRVHRRRRVPASGAPTFLRPSGGSNWQLGIVPASSLCGTGGIRHSSGSGARFSWSGAHRAEQTSETGATRE